MNKTDLETITNYMSQLRSTGLISSECLSRGLDYAEEYLARKYPEVSKLIRMELAAELWEDAAKAVGIHGFIK